MKKIFVLFVFFFAFCSFSWAECRNRLLLADISCSEFTCFCGHGTSCGGVGIGTCYGSVSCNSNGCFAQCSNNPSTGLWCLQDNQIQLGEPYCVNSNQAGLNIVECDNQCQADSVSNGGILLECQYDAIESKWYRYECHGGTNCSAGGCQRTYYNDETLCREKYCEDNPTLPQCQPPCDSTKWTCHTTTETTQTTVSSDNITCIKGTCFGLTYCEYVTRNTTECDNECGTHTEQTNEIPMTYEGACNDDNLSDDNMCSATKCIESQGQYSLYQMCQSRSVLNGEIQLLPRMVGGGMGSCKNAGYKPENDNLNDSSSVAQDSLQIPLECYQYGINCPEPDSSYSDPEDRTPQNGCICEPFDGQKYISQIVCPDGSSSILYSSCDEWKQPPISSSSTPESSSAAEWPASSGGMGKMGDWTTYSQGEDIKAALAVIAANTSKMGNNQVVVQQNQDFLNQFAYQDDGTEPQLNIPDSMLTYDSTQVDTNGILNAIFNRLDSSNKVLDTIPAATKVCPCLTFFSGNQNTSFANGHIQFKELVIDMADFHGFNFCTIISAIVVALASVVSFFIGFSIFKNISQ